MVVQAKEKAQGGKPRAFGVIGGRSRPDDGATQRVTAVTKAVTGIPVNPVLHHNSWTNP